MSVSCRIFILSLSALWFSACGSSTPVSSEEALSVSPSIFEGVKAVEQYNDKSWLIRWNQLPADGIVYGIFRAPEGEPFNFNQPEAVSQSNSHIYRSLEELSGPVQCFMVRITNFKGDKNEESLCTPDVDYSFKGVDSITRENDGSYILSWTDIKLEAVRYSIYESKNGESYDFTSPAYDGITEDNFFIPIPERGDQYCYIVRYYHDELPDDVNAQEVCTVPESIIEFSGILNAVTTDINVITLNWIPSEHPDIIGYRIYQGSALEERIKTVQKTESSTTINVEDPNRIYYFAVKTFDRYGREDVNTAVFPINMNP